MGSKGPSAAVDAWAKDAPHSVFRYWSRNEESVREAMLRLRLGGAAVLTGHSKCRDSDAEVLVGLRRHQEESGSGTRKRKRGRKCGWEDRRGPLIRKTLA